MGWLMLLIGIGLVALFLWRVAEATERLGPLVGVMTDRITDAAESLDFIKEELEGIREELADLQSAETKAARQVQEERFASMVDEAIAKAQSDRAARN